MDEPDVTTEFSADEIEAGRRLFAANWDFAAAVGPQSALPPPAGIEIAFAGRSNVGKSSLINALTGRRALARTSHTPGRTQELIFFVAPRPLTLVDMPGYGFAAAPKAKVAAWTTLVRTYLAGRANLARVYVLIDARHGLKPVDLPVLDVLDRAAVSYQIVLTKADEVKGSALAATLEGVRVGLARRPAAFPQIATTSARSALGISQLRATIARVVLERQGVPQAAGTGD